MFARKIHTYSMVPETVTVPFTGVSALRTFGNILPASLGLLLGILITGIIILG